MSELDLTNKMNSGSITAWMMQRFDGSRNPVAFQKEQSVNPTDAFSTVFQQATKAADSKPKQVVNGFARSVQQNEYLQKAQNQKEPLQNSADKKRSTLSIPVSDNQSTTLENTIEQVSTDEEIEETKPNDGQEQTVSATMEQLLSMLQKMIDEIKTAMLDPENSVDNEEQLVVLKVIEQLQSLLTNSQEFTGIDEKLMMLLKNGIKNMNNGEQQVDTSHTKKPDSAFVQLESLIKELGIQVEQAQGNKEKVNPAKLTHLIQKMEAVAAVVHSKIVEGLKNPHMKSSAEKTITAESVPLAEIEKQTATLTSEPQKTFVLEPDEPIVKISAPIQEAVPKTQVSIPIQAHQAGFQTFAGESRMSAIKADIEMVQVKSQAFSSLLNGLESGKSLTDQVIGKLNAYAETGKHEMELQLKPESLGKINMKLVEEKGLILAKFTTESEQVRAILESNMQLLKDALEKNGLSVQQLSVSVGNGKQEQTQEKANNERSTQNVFARQSSIEEETTIKDVSMLSSRIYDYIYGMNSTVNFSA